MQTICFCMAIDCAISISKNKKAYMFPSTIIECVKLNNLSKIDIQIISHTVVASLKHRNMHINMINTLKDYNSKIKKYISTFETNETEGQGNLKM